MGAGRERVSCMHMNGREKREGRNAHFGVLLVSVESAERDEPGETVLAYCGLLSERARGVSGRVRLHG